MSLDSLEVDVGGTKFKGVYLAILLSFGSTLGGGIWAASEFFSRLEILEENVANAEVQSETTNQRFDDFREVWVDDKKTLTNDIAVMKQQLEDNDIAGLQGKLTQLGTNLETIMSRQQELLDLQTRIVDVEKEVTQMQTTVAKAEVVTANAEELIRKLNRLQTEIDDIWEGLDFLANPYGTE